MAVSRNWANLRSFLRKTHNREVNEWFRDVDDPTPDNSTSRKQAKRACLVLPGESQNMALIKTLTFRYIVQQVHLKPDVYGIMAEPYQEQVVFRPQIHLFFKQDSQAVVSGRRAMEGQISFRLVNETSSTITETKARQWALKIKNEFALNNGYVWKKGKIKLVCKDAENGLNLGILALNELEGIELIKKVYDLIGGTYNEDLVREVTPKRDSETNPTGTELVFGKQRKKQRWRPVGNIRFQYALLTVRGMQHRIALVDRTRRFLDAYEWA